MTTETETGREESRIALPRSVRSTIWFVILLGVIGNGLWALIFGPGLGAVGRVLLTVGTLGSQTLRDWTYANAALDPTPLPSLMMLILVGMLPILRLQHHILELRGKPLKSRLKASLDRKTLDAAKKDPATSEVEHRTRLIDRQLRKYRLTLIILYGLISCAVFTGLLVVNQSILIWRVFNADLAICAAHLSDSEIKMLRSKFALVRSKLEYERLHEELSAVARSNGVALSTVTLW